MDTAHTSLITILIFIVATLYASVGHGGASGYLAILSFFAFTPAQMSSTALILNTVVSAIALYHFYRAGHFTWRWTWHCIAASLPFAFIGGLIRIQSPLYFLLLALVLLFASWRLYFTPQRGDEDIRTPALPMLLGGSALMGLVSGIVGVGGGIFLSPLMILLHWANPKQTAATSACFILANSLAGLLGRHLSDALADALVIQSMWPLILAGVLGSLIGSKIGSEKISGLRLRQLLAVVLVIAAAKMILKLL